MKGKLVDNYKKWKNNNCISDVGLCVMFSKTKYKETFSLFKPTEKDLKKLEKENLSQTFWASGLKSSSDTLERWLGLTPLRETIILLMCAMHDEL